MHILYITTVGGTMNFFPSIIKRLIEEGHQVDIATNECNGESRVPETYRELGCEIFNISCSRFPLDFGNIKAIKQINKICKLNKYDMVHCHTPIAAACTRIACIGLRRKGLRVFYTAHGFHFYCGSPMKNWIVYYPIEWICSWFTDVLITINSEDYNRSRRHFHAKNVKYVPGVGIDFNKFSDEIADENLKNERRKELNIPLDAKIIISVGELSVRKNQSVIIKAMKNLPKDVFYIIVGKGSMEEEFRQMIAKLGLKRRVLLLGYRNDIEELLKICDVFVFPSLQEGLPVALMEAMACGIPCVASMIRGNNDLINNNELVKCYDIDGWTSAICSKLKIGHMDYKDKLKPFTLDNVNNCMMKLYNEH